MQDISQESLQKEAVRLVSMKFNTEPKAYTRAVINTLGDLNKLCVVNPLRLEIETWFTLDNEINDDHAKLARRLNNKGITVYCNTALLGGINDSDEQIHSLAYTVRKTGLEFHHLYVAGLPIQQKWNIEHPVDSYNVVDIATKVRREGSGREIPRYMISTCLGEVDYGLTSSFVHDNGQLNIKLGCYDLSYYKNLSEKFVLPNGTTTDDIGDFHENGNWFYHTHLQVITQKGIDQGYLSKGYLSKGYCAARDLAIMDSLCPSPLSLFRNEV